MSRENQSELTFEGLQQILVRAGFDRAATINRSLAFHHRSTGTIITLAIPEDGRSVRSADLLSVLTRLEANGLADPALLDRIKARRLPKAS